MWQRLRLDIRVNTLWMWTALSRLIQPITRVNRSRKVTVAPRERTFRKENQIAAKNLKWCLKYLKVNIVLSHFSTESEDCVNNNKSTNGKTSSFTPPKELPTPPSDSNDSLSCTSTTEAYFASITRNGEVPCGIPGTALLSAPLSPPETSGSCTPPSGASTPAMSLDRPLQTIGTRFLPTVAALKRQDSNKSCDSATNATTCFCKWLKCGATIPDGDLLDHVKQVHVDPQKDINYSPPIIKVKAQTNANGSSINGSMRTRTIVNNACRTRNSVHATLRNDGTDSGDGKDEKQKKYVCLWEGCKVFNKPSFSFSWIERHFLFHCGDKPFKCIVDECGQRFASQVSLERHVNSHFNTYQPQQNQRPPKPVETTPSKSTKRRKLKKTKRSCISKYYF